MSLFRLDASIRIEGSTSSALADIVEGEWRAGNPGGDVVRRQIGLHPVPADAWRNAVDASTLPEAERTPEQRQASALARRLADEVVAANALLFAVPLYNFGVSQQFKGYVDLLLTDPRFAPGQASPIASKPTVLVTVQGGNYEPGTPREGWDHATEWMRRILADVWGTDLTIVKRVFTLVGVNPALDQFAELGARMKDRAEEQAHSAGHVLSARTRLSA